MNKFVALWSMKAMAQFFSNYKKKGGNSKETGCFFTFRSHVMDIELFNMQHIVPLKANVLQASFNCPYKQWGKAALNIEKPWMELHKEENKYESNQYCNQAI